MLAIWYGCDLRHAPQVPTGWRREMQELQSHVICVTDRNRIEHPYSVLPCSAVALAQLDRQYDESLHSQSRAQRKRNCARFAQLKRGDPYAFQRLYERYKNYVYSLCLRMCKDPSLAEDLTQDIFFHVWKKMASFKGQALFRTWLYRVTINRVLLHFRKHKVGTLPLER